MYTHVMYARETQRKHIKQRCEKQLFAYPCTRYTSISLECMETLRKKCNESVIIVNIMSHAPIRYGVTTTLNSLLRTFHWRKSCQVILSVNDSTFQANNKIRVFHLKCQISFYNVTLLKNELKKKNLKIQHNVIPNCSQLMRVKHNFERMPTAKSTVAAGSSHSHWDLPRISRTSLPAPIILSHLLLRLEWRR